MKISAAAAFLLPAAGLAAYTKDDYLSGRVHDALMAAKESEFDWHRSKGDYDPRKWKSWFKGKGSRRGKWGDRSDKVECENGLAIVEPGNANQTFRCKNMDFYDFISHEDTMSWAGEGNDVWGWVSPDGREFAALGQADGTAFMEVTKQGKLVFLGRLPQQSVISIWRDMKMVGDNMVIGTEAVDGGLQIFSMPKLLDIDPANPVNFSTENDLVGFYDGLPLGRSHNVVAIEELQMVAAVGSQPRNDSCAAGLIYVDLSDPSNPTSPGYKGPDERYQGKTICYGFNEDTLTIYDITDRDGINASTVLSTATYPNASYVHQGWFIDPNDQSFILSNDELDELNEAGLGVDGRPVTYIWDIRDLENPSQTGYYFSGDFDSIDHNMYTFKHTDKKGETRDMAIHSNYGNGVRIFDVTSVPEDPSGSSVTEAAFFDLHPDDDATGGSVAFVGTWSNYLFPSGYIFASSIERGAFLMKMSDSKGRGRGKGRGNGWGK